MKLFLIEMDWEDDYLLVTAESDARAEGMIDKRYVEVLQKCQHENIKENYGIEWIQELLDNKEERYKGFGIVKTFDYDLGNEQILGGISNSIIK